MDLQQFEKVFDRQMRIEGWDQKKIESTVALVLGVGGLGSCVSINLARLGVKKIILVDYDVVDAHNLNRQLLFSKKDVGKSKAEQGKMNLEFHVAGNTEIVAYNLDAVKNWGKIVELAKESTVVFGLIDYGEYFDVAVQAMCIALGLPMVMGGTFSGSLQVSLYRKNGGPCFACIVDGLKKEILEKVNPDTILCYTSLEGIIPKDNNPTGQSNVYLCSICSDFITSLYVSDLFDDECVKQAKTYMFYTRTFESVIFDAMPEPKCTFCAKLQPPAPEPEKKEGEGEKKDVEPEKPKEETSTEAK